MTSKEKDSMKDLDSSVTVLGKDPEGEFTEETKRLIAEARATPRSEYVSLDELRSKIRSKNIQEVDETASTVSANR